MVTTKKQITAAAVGWHPHAQCQGLALWVKGKNRPKGADPILDAQGNRVAGDRVWALDYRFNGRHHRITLGRADVMLGSDAVKLAQKHRVAINQGHDPLAEKDLARKADAANITVTTLFSRYLTDYAEGKKKPRSIVDDRAMFERDIKPTTLGRLRVPDVTGDDAMRLHRRISARGAKTMANRVLALLSVMMTCAERWGLRPQHSNPCRFVERNPERKTHRFLSREQLMALGAALTASERAPKGAPESESPAMVAAVRLLLFTGCRRGEVLKLKWDDVKLDAGLLDLPDSKTGRKLVTLNAAARQILSKLPRTSEYVFPGRNPQNPLQGLQDVWQRLRTRAGLDGVRLHDLRHSYASTAAGLGASLPIIGSLLGHTLPATTARYAGLADDPRRETAEAVGRQLSALLSPSEKPAAVVQMMKRRRRRG